MVKSHEGTRAVGEPMTRQVRRARATPAAPSVVAGRVEEAAALMRSLTYRRGVTDRELAAKWRVALQTVQNITAEASRVVARELRDPDRVEVTVGTRLEQVVLEGDDRDAVSAASVLAKLRGLNAAERVEVSQVGPNVEELRDVILAALEPFPEAHASVSAAVSAWLAGCAKL